MEKEIRSLFPHFSLFAPVFIVVIFWKWNDLLDVSDKFLTKKLKYQLKSRSDSLERWFNLTQNNKNLHFRWLQISSMWKLRREFLVCIYSNVGLLFAWWLCFSVTFIFDGILYFRGCSAFCSPAAFLHVASLAEQCAAPLKQFFQIRRSVLMTDRTVSHIYEVEREKSFLTSWFVAFTSVQDEQTLNLFVFACGVGQISIEVFQVI